MHLRHIVAALLLIAGTLCTHAEEKSAIPPSIVAVRAFVAALAERDEAKIRLHALPNSKLANLWAETLSEADKLSLARVLKDELRVLKAGESIPMEDGNFVIPPHLATESTVLVYGKSMLYPFPVHRVNDSWKVNSGPLLAAREKAKLTK